MRVVAVVVLATTLLVLNVEAEVTPAVDTASVVLRVDSPLVSEEIPAIIELERVGDRQLRFGEQRDAILELAVVVPGGVRVELPVGTVWRAQLRADGLWAASTVVAVSSQSGELRLEATPTGRVRGRLDGLDQNGPASLTVRFEPSPSDSDFESTSHRFSVDCPIAEAEYSCEIPIGSLDLRLRVEGFVSAYFWGIEVLPDRSVDLGRTKLRRGASVVAWIKVEEPPEGFDLSRAVATLAPQSAGFPTDFGMHLRKDLLVLEESPNDRGFVEFVGVEPGSYRIAVEHPVFPRTSIAPVDVFLGAETEVRELLLRPPVELRLTLTPPRDPWGNDWKVSLARRGEVLGHIDLVAESPSSRGGWSGSGLAPGEYRIVISDTLSSPWIRRDVDLTATGADLTLAMPFEKVEAHVSMDGEPVVGASVWFGGRRRATSIHRSTDGRGAAYAVVPEKESWLVEVHGENPPVRAMFADVEPRPHPTEPWSLVELKIPAGGIQVEVEREDGGAIHGATVQVLGHQDELLRVWEEQVGDDGYVELMGLGEGDWTVEAELQDPSGALWLSDGRLIPLDAARTVKMRLILRRSWLLSGQIVTPDGGGLPGARIVAFPEFPASGAAFNRLPNTTTGLSGEFEISLPAAAEGARLTVLPPGFTAFQLPPLARGADPVVIPVDRYGGTLVLTFDPLREESPQLPPLLYRRHHFGLPDLLAWAMTNGGEVALELGRLVIPNMESGRYVLCPPGVPFHPVLPVGASGVCSSGELSPFGTLDLDVTDARSERDPPDDLVSRRP